MTHRGSSQQIRDPGSYADAERAQSGTRRRRWWLGLIIASLALLTTLAASIWFVWLPQYRPSLREGERLGVDVSHHQGEVRWLRVVEDGIAFAYIKATEGGDFVDERFAENWSGATRAGIDRGAYHFFTLCSPGHVQAQHFLSVVPEDEGALPPSVDLEVEGNCRIRPDAAEVHRELRKFVELVEAVRGKEVVLYIGDEFERRYSVRQVFDRLIWHRSILLRPDADGWWIWQVMGFAHVDGIEGDVDLNVMRSSHARLTPRPGR